MTCVIDCRLEECWFFGFTLVCFNFQIVYIQPISQKGLVHTLDKLGHVEQGHEVSEKVLFLQVFAKWIGRGVREKQ